MRTTISVHAGSCKSGIMRASFASPIFSAKSLLRTASSSLSFVFSTSIASMCERRRGMSVRAEAMNRVLCLLDLYMSLTRASGAPTLMMIPSSSVGPHTTQSCGSTVSAVHGSGVALLSRARISAISSGVISLGVSAMFGSLE